MSLKRKFNNFDSNLNLNTKLIRMDLNSDGELINLLKNNSEQLNNINNKMVGILKSLEIMDSRLSLIERITGLEKPTESLCETLYN